MGIKRVLLQCMYLNGKDCSVRLILVYGPQENDSEDKDSFYHDISVQVEMAYLNGDLLPMSNNDEQLFELRNKYNLKPMNASEQCEGVFTRIHKYKQTIDKSVLDYVFISSYLEEYFTSIQIDEKNILHHGVALNMVKYILIVVLLSFA